MNRTKRFLFQSFLWLTIWVTAWLLLDDDIDFIRKNGPSLVFQIAVIASLIFYVAPAFLFKKKYILFVLISLGLLVFSSYFISEGFTGPIDGPPNFPEGPPGDHEGPGPGRRPMAPPQFMINFLVLSLAYILATLIETFLFAQRKERESIRIKNENLQTELKLLKSQINPHFLFNALNNIYALSVTNSNKTQQSISALANMLRYVLYECDRPVVPIQKEIEYIENYLELFALKSSKAFPITTDFQVLDKGTLIAPMLLIPFLENALKHGNIDSNADASLRIKIHSNVESLLFEIENSIPQTPIKKDAVGGIG
ncbi:MAG: histidine kinase, partial [Pricia sp.]|nr:histidine kinase [Pricia sp.]